MRPSLRWTPEDAMTLPSLNPLSELRSSIRALRCRRLYVLATVSTLAVGVASSSLVFSVVNAMALAPLPYEEPERLVNLYERSLEDPDIDRWPVAPGNFADWREVEAFEGMGAYRHAASIIVGDDSATRVRTTLVTGDLFSLVGATPALGRVITPDDVRTEAPVAVLSHGLWTRLYGADENIVGQQIEVTGRSVTVVGVMPGRFRLPFDGRTDMWRPMIFSPESATDRRGGQIFPIARLAEGLSIDQATAQLAQLVRGLAEDHPDTNGGRGVTVLTMRESWLEWRLPALRVFGISAAVLLLVAALNLAGLMLSRGLSRQRELAVRAALGAHRSRVSWALLAEGLVISVMGGALGLVLGAGLLPAVVSAAPPNWGGPMLAEAGIDLRVALFSLVTAGGSGIVASLLPVYRLTGPRLEATLRGSGPSSPDGGQLRLRRFLVLTQAIMAVALLTVAGMVGRSMYHTLSYDVGFDPENVLSAEVPLDPEEIADPSSFYVELRDRAAALPGAAAAALANIAPLSGGGYPVAVTADGSDPRPGLSAEAYNRDVQYRAVDPHFFPTLGVEILRGRGVSDADVAGGERVAVVNQAFVDRILGQEEALGAHLRTARLFGNSQAGHLEPMRVVGVVGDVAEWGIWMQPPIVYVPAAQAPSGPAMTVLVKARANPHGLAEPLKELVWALGSRWPVERVSTLVELRDGLYRMNDFLLLLLAIFAGAATLLTAMGLYGVVGLHVSLRDREFSVRRALGATSGTIGLRVVREGLVLVIAAVGLAGLGVALAGRWLAEGWLGNFLFQVNAFDLTSFGGASFLLLSITGIAAFMPALRAARTDPAGTLRGE
jgi:predicted permease